MVEKESFFEKHIFREKEVQIASFWLISSMDKNRA